MAQDRKSRQHSQGVRKHARAGEKHGAAARKASERAAREAERYRARRRKAREKEYYRDLAKLERTGLYAPKREPGQAKPPLTKYRKGRINKAIRENQRYFDTDKFAFVQAPKPARTEAAKKPQYGITPKGIFVPKGNAKKVSIRYSRRAKEWVIKRTGRRKEGTTTGKTEDELIPLADVDTMERARLLEHAKTWGKLRKGQYVTYILHTYGREGYSHHLYSSAEAALDAFENRYDKRLDFARLYRELTIERTTVDRWKRDSAPHRPARYFAGKKGKRMKARRKSLSPGGRG